MNDKFKAIDCGMRSLAVFRSLLNDEIINELWQLLDGNCEDVSVNIYNYSEFVSKLYKSGANLSEYVLKAVLQDENFYISGKAKGETFDSFIEEAMENELRILQEFSQLQPQDFALFADSTISLPKWKTTEFDFVKEYRSRIGNIERYGYGKFAQNRMFILRKGEIVPVKHPDPQRLSSLFGYERERKAVIDNTLALLSGKPAQNVLLYGDAGTGKSSTVKAVVNEFADKGLRLIEITKEQLRDIPDIIESISANPLKFIIFIDDLSFVSGEDCFGALKATLEGSVSARTGNTAIYATSNRRHLVKESFSDRDGDDVHRNDSMQETLSLSARFGLRVNFSKPDKKSYVQIAQELAAQHGINIDSDTLALKAEQFAMQGSGRSPRTARQFVNQLINEQK
ncbi:MAG: ATP-binding protein [Ruminococcus flavefaciens]|nr:ATP-binding protein [Ruminococcus flavefaciens]MCM1060377.1 ATP-binding protein [Eubacterium sp.]